MIKVVQYRRLVTMAVLLAVGFATLGYRLVDLQVFHHETLRKESEDKTRRTLLLEPRRGEIRDRQGILLGGSVFVKTIYANPILIGPYQPQVARALAPILEMSEADLINKLRPQTYVNTKGEIKPDPYVFLKRKVSLETWGQIQATMKTLSFGVDESRLLPRERAFYRGLRSGAIFAAPYDEQMRVYPNKTLAAHVLGFVGSVERDSILGKVRTLAGAEGIERIMNSTLNGVPGWRTTEVVRKHELVPFREQDVEPRPGQNVILTIDAGLQHIVETELSAVMQKHSPVSASVVVVRPSTGEVLAMATLPTFDPNHPGDAPSEFRRNRVIADVAEPGSTFKIVAISAALQENVVNLDTRLDCESGHFFYAGRSLKDDHPAGILTVEEIVSKSSNIGTAKVAIQLGPTRMYDYINRFGFGHLTGIRLGGEVDGLVYPPKNWSKLSITRIPIGQGIAVTPLQMVMAMSAIANHGRLMQPMLIDRVEDENGTVVSRSVPQQVRQVISEAAAQEMVAALKTVVSTNGTARRAMLEHYSVAGKTGTAQKPDHETKGYSHDRYFSSFVGFFPANAPELCIAVVLDEPKLPNYYGGTTAAPAFRNIAERAAKYLAIKPDLAPTGSFTANLTGPVSAAISKP